MTRAKRRCFVHARHKYIRARPDATKPRSLTRTAYRASRILRRLIGLARNDADMAATRASRIGGDNLSERQALAMVISIKSLRHVCVRSGLSSPLSLFLNYPLTLLTEIERVEKGWKIRQSRCQSASERAYALRPASPLMPPQTHNPQSGRHRPAQSLCISSSESSP